MWGYGGPHDVEEPAAWLLWPAIVTVMAVTWVATAVSDHVRGWVTPTWAALATLVVVGGSSTILAIALHRRRLRRGVAQQETRETLP